MKNRFRFIIILIGTSGSLYQISNNTQATIINAPSMTKHRVLAEPQPQLGDLKRVKIFTCEHFTWLIPIRKSIDPAETKNVPSQSIRLRLTMKDFSFFPNAVQSFAPLQHLDRAPNCLQHLNEKWAEDNKNAIPVHSEKRAQDEKYIFVFSINGIN